MLFTELLGGIWVGKQGIKVIPGCGLISLGFWDNAYGC